ncbi:MAG: HipA domain-containing protein [Prevotellaceae bacterium]|nr:HipA domain-containing protein [Prevotellaceae bacterium]
MRGCLLCYQPLAGEEGDFHAACSKSFFGTPVPPSMDYRAEQLDELALQIIEDQTSLTGVQPKLSLNIQKHKLGQRLTIVGMWGGFICKPQTASHKQLPEVEDLTMHLAEMANIKVVPHTLMRMADGELCYLTRRIDRTADGRKVAMEDLCQLTERQTEYKYRSSYERAAKAIAQYSSVPKLDVVDFFEVVFFSWLTGDNDMHLKNFSLYAPDGLQRLTPAYDLLNAAIVNPKDEEELALTLNGRKRRIEMTDFLAAAHTMDIPEIVPKRLLRKYKKLLPRFETMIGTSFLSLPLKQAYIALLAGRLAKLQPQA